MKRFIALALCCLLFGRAAPSGSAATDGSPVCRGSFFLSLWEIDGSPVETEDCPFLDLSPDDPLAGAARHLYALGIVKGSSATALEPEAALTWEMAAVLAHRFCNRVELPEPKLAAAAKNVSPWAEQGFAWALEACLIPAEVKPGDTLTRAEADALLEKLAERALYLHPVTGAQVLERLGLSLFAPAEAANPVYRLIDRQTAELSFTLEDVPLVYRVATGELRDVTGIVFPQGVHTEVLVGACSGWYCAEPEIGSHLWWGDSAAGLSFSLFTPSPLSKVPDPKALLTDYARQLYLFTQRSALLELEGNPSTGYGWQLVDCDKGLAVSAPWVSPLSSGAALPGAPVVYRFAVIGLQPGIRARLRLGYFRSWEGSEKALRWETRTALVDADGQLCFIAEA